MSVPTQAPMVAHLNALAVDAAIQDPAFRAALLADPNGISEKALGTALPPGAKQGNPFSVGSPLVMAGRWADNKPGRGVRGPLS